MSARGLKHGSHCARVLEVLADGREHSFHEIHERAGFMRLNSRVAELRSKHGYAIECRRDGNDYLYTLASSPQPEPATSACRSVDPLPGSGSEGEREPHAEERHAQPEHHHVGDDPSSPSRSPHQLTLLVAA